MGSIRLRMGGVGHLWVGWDRWGGMGGRFRSWVDGGARREGGYDFYESRRVDFVLCILGFDLFFGERKGKERKGRTEEGRREGGERKAESERESEAKKRTSCTLKVSYKNRKTTEKKTRSNPENVDAVKSRLNPSTYTFSLISTSLSEYPPLVIAATSIFLFSSRALS